MEYKQTLINLIEFQMNNITLNESVTTNTKGKLELFFSLCTIRLKI